MVTLSTGKLCGQITEYHEGMLSAILQPISTARIIVYPLVLSMHPFTQNHAHESLSPYRLSIHLNYNTLVVCFLDMRGKMYKQDIIFFYTLILPPTLSITVLHKRPIHSLSKAP